MSTHPGRRPTTGPSRSGGAARDGRGAAGRSSRPARNRPSSGRSGTAPPGAATPVGRRATRTASAGVPGSATPPRRPRIRSVLVKQAMVLGLVVCAVALVVAFPLRSYLAQRADLNTQVSTQQQLQDQLAALQVKAAALSDPDYIRAEARRRLQYVSPGDTVYQIYTPTPTVVSGSSVATVAPAAPWYSQLWDTVSEPAGGTAHR